MSVEVVPLFTSLPPGEVAELDRLGTEVNAKRAEVIRAALRYVLEEARGNFTTWLAREDSWAEWLDQEFGQLLDHQDS